tara:strand:- start:536 stop:751 length:216 start_codon:yes stop_codon:yes gene_type:complete
MNMDPFTPKEIKAATNAFFDVFDAISLRMPQGSTVEDTLKVLEHVNKTATKLRGKQEKEERDARFGFLQKN